MNSYSNNCNGNSNGNGRSTTAVKSCPTVLACNGATGSVALPTTAVTAATPLTVATLNINNSCLDNPCTALDFSSNVVVTAAGAAATTASFTLQVFKVNLCNPTAPAIPVGNPWVFTSAPTAATAGAVVAGTFSFSVCDCNNCICNCSCNCGCCNNNCYSYVVRIIASTALAAATGTAVINNATLKAISTCSNICC